MSFLGGALARIRTARRGRTGEFKGPAAYWEERYRSGGNSGSGSYGRLAEFKAEVANGIVREFGVTSVVEFGCGDGHQLSLARYPAYFGYDISATSIERCSALFAGDATKRFDVVENYDPNRWFDLALSLDVIFHLTEDEIFDAYMSRLFTAADRLVLIYSSDEEKPPRHKSPHVRHRKFTAWVAEHQPEWTLVRSIGNRHPRRRSGKTESFSDFYLYSRQC